MIGKILSVVTLRDKSMHDIFEIMKNWVLSYCNIFSKVLSSKRMSKIKVNNIIYHDLQLTE